MDLSNLDILLLHTCDKFGTENYNQPEICWRSTKKVIGDHPDKLFYILSINRSERVREIGEHPNVVYIKRIDQRYIDNPLEVITEHYAAFYSSLHPEQAPQP